MAIMVNNQGEDSVEWQHALQLQLPDMPVYAYPELPSADEINYAAVWHHPHEDLFRYNNLKAVLILGAGTDHIDAAPRLPDVPIVRLIDPAVGTDMSQYVLYWVMHFQRGYETYREQQQQQYWQRYVYPLASDYQITILGAGMIATFIAARIARIGFKVNVWNRSPRDSMPDDVSFYSGESGLSDVLKNTQVLVNCLPLKPQTNEFIDHRVFNQLPTGASFINVSRGGVVRDHDLIQALNAGRLANAALDTVTQEPLSKNHPFWSHNKVFITPHMSGATYTRTAAKVVADNIKRIEVGEAPYPIYQPPQRQ